MQQLLDFFTVPLRLPFMQSALLAVVLIGIACAGVGAYVVLRRMAFIGDALAHTVLPGVVIAFLNGWNLQVGALIAGMLTALGIGWLSRRQQLREDSAIGVMFTSMFALGILLLVQAQSFRDLTHILFGNLLGVTRDDLLFIAPIALITLIVLFFLHKEFELTSYDPTHADVIGLNSSMVRYILLALLAFAVVASIQVVGVVLTSALLVTPAAAAALLADRLPRVMLIATVIAILSGVIGLYASYYLDVSSGAAVVLTATALFALAWVVRALRDRRR